MARLPDADIQRLKKEISLVRLVEAQGHALRRQGKDMAIRCPFHEGDDTPSLVITPASNLFHCFACEAAGSVIDWVMRTRGVSFRFACEILQNDAGLIAEGGTATVATDTTTTLASDLSADVDRQTTLVRVIDYYHATLKQSPEALAYLERRGLNHPELVETFRLGFANRTLGYRLPAKNRKAGAELRGQLQTIGLLRESGHEHFNGSLVVPVIAPTGEITEVYGRKITDGLRRGTAHHLYLPGPHRGVWNEAALAASEEIIVCEALIDAMTFWVAGYRNVTASYGTGGYTADHAAAFARHGVRRVLIAYDRDEAGNAAAEKLAGTLNAAGIDAFRILLPKGMDVNAYAAQVTPAAKSLGLAIRQAEWLGNGQAPTIRTVAVDADPLLEAVAAAEPPEPEVVAEPPVDTDTPPVDDAAAIAELLDDDEDRDDNEEADTVDDAIVNADTTDDATSAVVPPLPSSAADVTHEPATSTETAATTAAPPEPPVASPLPPVPAPLDEHTGERGDTTFRFGERQYRVRGLTKNLSHEQLRVNVLVHQGDHLHVDTFDLYQSRPRQAFINQAATELGVSAETVKRDLGQVLIRCEALQEAEIRAALEPAASAAPTIEPAARAAALALLKAPDLLDRILADFETAGVVGEEINKLVGYLACVSRKLDRPLAVIIQSSSAAGKSSLMEAILALMPEEDRVQYSAMTGQSLFYMGETNLKHRILAIAEEEGAESASYALKLLQSEGELTIASTGKDEATGKLVTREYHVEGPVMLFLTTTAIDIDEELMNRCLVLTVNETREQTQAIHAMQRRQQTLAGLLAQADKRALVERHRNAQRLLRPLLVANPHAERLTFIDDKTRTRRDHLKYLTLIRAIALLHQHQREIKRVVHEGETLEYIEVTRDDIAVANRLANDILGRSLDELPPQTRTLLTLVHEMVEAACAEQRIEIGAYRFSRRDVRARVGWTDFQIKKHMQRLSELEYVLVHRGGRGQSFVYELLYRGEGGDGAPFLLGLQNLDGDGETGPDETKPRDYDGENEPPTGNKERSSSPRVAPIEPPGRAVENGPDADAATLPTTSTVPALKNAVHEVTDGTPPSYRTDTSAVAAASSAADVAGVTTAAPVAALPPPLAAASGCR